MQQKCIEKLMVFEIILLNLGMVLLCILQEFLGLVNTFTAIGFSETSPVMHLNEHISRSQ